MSTYTSYEDLIKPSWSPPAEIFGPVWTFLYLVIAISFGAVFLKAISRELPLVVALPFALNLVFNFAFTTIQFGWRNNFLASVDILLVLLTLIWALFAIWPYSKIIALSNLPYLLWVSFATILQLTITYLNK